ncbi:MAG: hypothetical protein WKG07_45880 [Hymenobacter sp.]
MDKVSRSDAVDARSGPPSRRGSTPWPTAPAATWPPSTRTCWPACSSSSPTTCGAHLDGTAERPVDPALIAELVDIERRPGHLGRAAPGEAAGLELRRGILGQGAGRTLRRPPRPRGPGGLTRRAHPVEPVTPQGSSRPFRVHRFETGRLTGVGR